MFGAGCAAIAADELAGVAGLRRRRDDGRRVVGAEVRHRPRGVLLLRRSALLKCCGRRGRRCGRRGCSRGRSRRGACRRQADAAPRDVPVGRRAAAWALLLVAALLGPGAAGLRPAAAPREGAAARGVLHAAERVERRAAPALRRAAPDAVAAVLPGRRRRRWRGRMRRRRCRVRRRRRRWCRMRRRRRWWWRVRWRRRGRRRGRSCRGRRCGLRRRRRGLLFFRRRRRCLRQHQPALAVGRGGKTGGLETQHGGAGEQKGRHGILRQARIHIGVVPGCSLRRVDSEPTGNVCSIQGAAMQLVPAARDNLRAAAISERPFIEARSCGPARALCPRLRR